MKELDGFAHSAGKSRNEQENAQRFDWSSDMNLRVRYLGSFNIHTDLVVFEETVAGKVWNDK